MKSKKFLASMLALTLLSTTALAGCGDSDNNASGNTTGGEENGNKPKMDKEQYLNLFGSEPTILDPTLASITDTWAAIGPIHEGLTRVVGTKDGADKIEPGVAETWESNEDSTEFTFHLRKDAKWQDGTPITAKDFEYSIKRVIDPSTGSEYSTFFNPFIKGAEDVTTFKAKDENGKPVEGAEAKIDELLANVGVKAVDDYTLKFELVNPTPYFIQLSYFPTLKPVQKAAIEKYGDQYGTEAEKTMGNGPFVLSEWVHNGNMTFTKNENYWDKDNVYLEKVNWVMSNDKNSSMNSLFSGEVDRGRVSDPDWLQKFDSADGFTIIEKQDYGTESLIFNVNKGPMKNKKIRQAFAASFSREDYSKDMADGMNVPGYEYVPETISIGDESFQKQVGNPQYVKQMIDETKDPKALLIEGMKEEGLGDDPSKLKVVMCMRGDNEWARKQGEWFQNKWKETLGTQVQIDTMKYQIMYDRMKQHDFDIAVGGWSADFDDPSNFLDIYHSQKGHYNYLGWKNAEYDKLLDEASVTADAKKRAELYTKCEEILTKDDILISPFEHGKSKYYQRDYVKNYNVPGLAYYCMDYKGVYTDGR